MNYMAKILVAGDDPGEMRARALVMEFAGHQCATAASLQEAVKLLGESFFDLVVTDCKLGGNSGAEIVSNLKCAAPETAVMALAENSETAGGADAVLTVPCSPEEFFQCIERLSLV